MDCSWYITLCHPGTELPGTFFDHGRFTNSWADGIMRLHAEMIISKLTEQERSELYGQHYIKMLSIPDVYGLSAPGLQMADFWMDFRVDRIITSDEWYVHVTRCPVKGWQLHILVSSKTETDFDADCFTADIWQAYKTYFAHSPPEQYTVYNEQAFEDLKPKLIGSTQGDFHVLDTMKIPLLGNVFRTRSQNERCMLWADANDPQYKDTLGLDNTVFRCMQ